MFLMPAVVSGLKSQPPKCSPWLHSGAKCAPDYWPAHHICILVVKAQQLFILVALSNHMHGFSALFYPLIAVAYIHFAFQGCTWNVVHCVHSLPTFCLCATVFMLIQCDHSRPRLQLSHLACCDVWDRGSLSTNGGGRLYGEFRNDSANVIDDPVGFFFLLIFFKGKVDGLHLIKPSHLQRGPLC